MSHENKHVDAAVSCFDNGYLSRGLASQRSYPNEALIQFVASRFFGLESDTRKTIRILEVGCGSGANLWMLAKEGFDVYGMDSSRAGLDLAQHHLAEKWGVSARLCIGSFTELPYEDGYFDAVVDVVSLQHLPLAETAIALSEVRRVLKADGEFFSYRLSDRSVMYHQGQRQYIDPATIENIFPPLPLANNGPCSFFSPALARMVYQTGGFGITSLETIGRTYQTGAFVEYLAIVAKRVV